MISGGAVAFLQCDFLTGDLNCSNNIHYHVVLSYCHQMQAQNSLGADAFPDTADSSAGSDAHTPVKSIITDQESLHEVMAILHLGN